MMDDHPFSGAPAPKIARTTHGPRAIHPAIKKVWLFSGILGAFFLGLAFAVPGVALFLMVVRKEEFGGLALLGLIALGLAWLGIFVLTVARIQRQWQNWTYEVREHDVVLSWGVLWRTRRHVARDRIQHLDINSGPLDRRFGLVQVGVHTAGAAGTVGVIPGLTPQEAEDLRDMILESQAEHV